MEVLLSQGKVLIDWRLSFHDQCLHFLFLLLYLLHLCLRLLSGQLLLDLLGFCLLLLFSRWLLCCCGSFCLRWLFCRNPHLLLDLDALFWYWTDDTSFRRHLYPGLLLLLYSLCIRCSNGLFHLFLHLHWNLFLYLFGANWFAFLLLFSLFFLLHELCLCRLFVFRLWVDLLNSLLLQLSSSFHWKVKWF